ncbi:glycosyl hydrolase family 28-related protein [Mucilaginibacter sp.]|uniref:glycosyl hydrolase family 28-related protein n=1 Tax=Mucilaginibacter sp. TaxID=1882438 RepID=UPI0026140F61|nr:glycosyl hydrolase family 28-related protein [Mucilaginibacter sp.]MDB4925333.1 hypothetical protein [Mucilaginibacter sp.]
MKKLLSILSVSMLFMLSCKKSEQVTTSNNLATANTKTTSVGAQTTTTSLSTPPNTANTVNVKSYGATGDGVTDDTQAIRKALDYAKANGKTAIYFPDGSYIIGGSDNTSGIIQLKNGVGLMGNSPATCHIKLSQGRYNPPSIFYQAWWNEPTVSNVVIQGIDFDGSSFGQTFSSDYEYCHALSINNGQNIEVMNCKFENLRGDGLLFGDTFESSLNLRMTYNVNVHDSEFFNIYREGTMFCATNTGSFYNNNVHGNGYLVGGVDIERHSVNETVTNISVYNNLFNFSDGYGPVERGGPSVKYRRAVTMGFFYGGYTNAVADGRSGSHKIYNNTIYQGQIDCWGHTDVGITNNTFTINAYENITGVNMLSAAAINVADPANTSGLVNVVITGNTINSAMGNAIAFNHYSSVTANSNIINGSRLDGISIYNTTGYFDSNNIQNAGLSTQKASGIVINGNTNGSLLVSRNKVTDTRSGSNRTVNYGVAIQSQNNGTVMPRIEYNTGTNLIGGVVSLYYYQQAFATLLGNS